MQLAVGLKGALGAGEAEMTDFRLLLSPLGEPLPFAALSASPRVRPVDTVSVEEPLAGAPEFASRATGWRLQSRCFLETFSPEPAGRAGDTRRLARPRRGLSHPRAMSRAGSVLLQSH